MTVFPCPCHRENHEPCWRTMCKYERQIDRPSYWGCCFVYQMSSDGLFSSFCGGRAVDRSPSFAPRVQLQKVSKWPGSSPYPQARQQWKADHRWHLGDLSHCAFDWVCDWHILSLLVWYFHSIIWKWLRSSITKALLKLERFICRRSSKVKL